MLVPNANLLFSNSFRKISDDWARLYAVTPEVSPFLHPAAMDIAIRYFYPYYFAWRCRPVFAVYQEDEKSTTIVPLLKFRNGSYRLFGDVNGFNECGCVYEGIDSLKSCLKLLKSKVGPVELARIDERSPLAAFASENCKTTNNVAIYFGDSYDEYFKTLSSSVRQNIRTAYNRLAKEDHVFEVQTYFGGGCKALPFNEIINMYCKRHSDRYGVKTSKFRNWFLKHQSFATRLYRYAPNAMTMYLTIDDKPAAFMSGMFNGERLIVPRLSIDNEYRRYSPGMILICESIRYLINNTSISILDLSQGEEEYKYKLGGVKHISCKFTI